MVHERFTIDYENKFYLVVFYLWKFFSRHLYCCFKVINSPGNILRLTHRENEEFFYSLLSFSCQCNFKLYRKIFHKIKFFFAQNAMYLNFKNDSSIWINFRFLFAWEKCIFFSCEGMYAVIVFKIKNFPLMRNSKACWTKIFLSLNDEKNKIKMIDIQDEAFVGLEVYVTSKWKFIFYLNSWKNQMSNVKSKIFFCMVWVFHFIKFYCVSQFLIE